MLPGGSGGIRTLSAPKGSCFTGRCDSPTSPHSRFYICPSIAGEGVEPTWLAYETNRLPQQPADCWEKTVAGGNRTRITTMALSYVTITPRRQLNFLRQLTPDRRLPPARRRLILGLQLIAGRIRPGYRGCVASQRQAIAHTDHDGVTRRGRERSHRVQLAQTQ